MDKNINNIPDMRQRPILAPNAIQDLLDKYLSGDTSNEEEAELRIYFEEHGDDIPEDWKPYRALFSYIDFEKLNLSSLKDTEEEKMNPMAETPAKVHAPISPMADTSTKDTSTKTNHRPVKLLAWVAAAVVALALVITGIHQLSKPQTDYYAVIDGKVYTNKSLVHDEALDALQEVAGNSKEDDAFSALDMMQ